MPTIAIIGDDIKGLKLVTKERRIIGTVVGICNKVNGGSLLEDLKDGGVLISKKERIYQCQKKKKQF